MKEGLTELCTDWQDLPHSYGDFKVTFLETNVKERIRSELGHFF